jgi:hypothetical protein
VRAEPLGPLFLELYNKDGPGISTAASVKKKVILFASLGRKADFALLQRHRPSTGSCGAAGKVAALLAESAGGRDGMPLSFLLVALTNTSLQLVFAPASIIIRSLPLLLPR